MSDAMFVPDYNKRRIAAMHYAGWTPLQISLQLSVPEEVIKREVELIERNRGKGLASKRQRA